MNIRKMMAVAAMAATGVQVAMAAEDLPITDGLTLHYDASVASSILENDAGAVTNWNPITGSIPLVDAATAYDDDDTWTGLLKAPVYKVTENGRVGIQLSHGTVKADGSLKDAEYTFMCVTNKQYQSFKTMFVVSRQIQVGYYGAIVGRVTGTDCRYMRYYDNYQTCAWANDWGGTAFVNGNAYTNAVGKPCFDPVGGTTIPHTLAVRVANDTKTVNFESIGGAYLWNKGKFTSNICYDPCVVHEIVFYNRFLSEEEMKRVSRYLCRKWGLETDCVWTDVSGDHDWNNKANWEDGCVPDASRSVIATGDVTIALDGDIAFGTLTNLSDSAKLTLIAADDVGISGLIAAPYAVEKRGAGTVTLNGEQAYSGATTVSEGELKVCANIDDGMLGAFGTVTFHVDAMMDADAIKVSDSGAVTSWVSSANNIILKSPSTDHVFDNAVYCHEDPRIVTDDWGRKVVRFGAANDNSWTGTFLYATIDAKKVDFEAGTQFYVSRQLTTKVNGGFSGCITNYNSRIYRWYDTDYQWGKNHEYMWENGRLSTDELNNTFEASGTTKLNLLAVRDSKVQKFDIIGGQYLYRTDSHKPTDMGHVQFDVYEVIFFKEALTDEQIARVSKILMDKWSVPAQAELEKIDYIPNTPVTVSAGATLDLGGIEKTTLQDIAGPGTVMGDGLVDVNGGVCSNVTFACAVTNSAATAATIWQDVAESQSTVFDAALFTGSFELVKAGPGSLAVSSKMPETMALTVKGGTVKAKDFAASDFGTVSAHLDASKPELLTTNALGQIRAVASVDAGAVSFTAAAEAFDCRSVPFHCGYPKYGKCALGYPSFRFGLDTANNFTGTWFKADSNFKTRTVFVVTTEREARPSFAICGHLYDFDGRITRPWSVDGKTGADYCWNDQEENSSLWANGEYGAYQGHYAFTTNSALTRTHIFVTRRLASASDATCTGEMFGGAWVRQGESGEATAAQYIFAKNDIHEFLAFAERLTDEQIEQIMAYLMNKWNTPRQAEVDGIVLPRNVTIAGNATMDANGYDFALDTLVIDANGQVTAPLLNVVGRLDLANVDLVLRNAGGVNRDSELVRAAPLDGDAPKSVEGLPDQRRLRKIGDSLWYHFIRGLLLIIK